MSFQNKVFVLKLAVAFAFLSAGILKLIEPVMWIEWLPVWFTNVVTFNKDHVIFILGTLELFLGFWLLVPWYAHITAAIASAYFLLTILFEGFSRYGMQCMALWLATVALTLLLWPKKLHLMYQDH